MIIGGFIDGSSDSFPQNFDGFETGPKAQLNDIFFL
jgi:hypothetical protein